MAGIIGRQYFPAKDDPEADHIGWNWKVSELHKLEHGVDHSRIHTASIFSLETPSRSNVPRWSRF